MFLDVSHFKPFQKVSKRFKSLQTVSKLSKLIRRVSNTWKTFFLPFQNVSNRMKTFHESVHCFKYRNSSKAILQWKGCFLARIYKNRKGILAWKWHRAIYFSFLTLEKLCNLLTLLFFVLSIKVVHLIILFSELYTLWMALLSSIIMWIQFK